MVRIINFELSDRKGPGAYTTLTRPLRHDSTKNKKRENIGEKKKNGATPVCTKPWYGKKILYRPSRGGSRAAKTTTALNVPAMLEHSAARGGRRTRASRFRFPPSSPRRSTAALRAARHPGPYFSYRPPLPRRQKNAGLPGTDEAIFSSTATATLRDWRALDVVCSRARSAAAF